MNESSELLESFCTGHACVRAERGGDGGDGAVADVYRSLGIRLLFCHSEPSVPS